MEKWVLLAGHLVMGFAYYMKYAWFQTEEGYQEERKRALERFSESELEMGEELFNTTWFVLLMYLLFGYFNILFSLNRLYRKIVKKKSAGKEEK